MNQKSIIRFAMATAGSLVTVGIALFIINSVPQLRSITKQA